MFRRFSASGFGNISDGKVNRICGFVGGLYPPPLIPMDSNGFQWSPTDSDGVRRTPIGLFFGRQVSKICSPIRLLSHGFCLKPEESHWTPLESNGTRYYNYLMLSNVYLILSNII